MPAYWPKPSGAMKAIDTNVVVRYLTGDDPRQAARARAAVNEGSVFVSTTVAAPRVRRLRFGSPDHPAVPPRYPYRPSMYAAVCSFAGFRNIDAVSLCSIISPSSMNTHSSLARRAWAMLWVTIRIV